MMADDKREIRGFWWFPDTPNERWFGTLMLEPGEGPLLTVMIPQAAWTLFNWQLRSAIYGHDEHGKPVTILYPGPPSTSGSSALAQQRFHAGVAILGLELPDSNAFNVNSFTFRLQHLYEWSGITGFQMGEFAQPSSDFNIRIHYSRPEDQVFTIDQHLTVGLRTECSFSPVTGEQKVSEDLVIDFESEEGLNLSRYYDLLNAVRLLLHFAILCPVYPLEVTAQKSGYGNTIGTHFHHHHIEVWTSLIRERVKSETYDQRWVFRFSDLRPRFAEFFATWLKFLKVYDEAIGCYATTVYHSLPPEVANLCLTQALEAYHGIQNASHHNRDFRSKFHSLAEQYKSHLQGLVDSTEEFAEQVRDNRHFYTHHNPDDLKGGTVVSGAKLIQLNEKLKLIFQMCVLTQIGIPPDRFTRLRRQLASTIIDMDLRNETGS
jgi:hypothetical protein